MPRDTSRNPYAVSLVKNCDTLTLYKIGRSKNWYYRFWCRGESKYRRASTRTSDKREAEAIAKLAWRQDGGEASNRAAPEMTIRYWADAFLEWQEKAVNRGELSAVVQRMDRSRLACVSEYFGSQAIGQISSPKVDQFRDHLFATKKGISPATARHYLISLKKVLAFAHKNEALSAVPVMPKYKASDLESPRCKLDKHEYKVLGDYLRRVAKSSKDQAELYDCVIFLVNTLIRPSELKLLKFEHVRVTEEDDGRECVWVKPPRTKVKAYNWETPSMPGAFPALERMRARVEGRTGYLFFSQTENRDMAIQKLGGLFRSALRECGLYESAEGVRTLYSLRHTGITWRLESGAAVYDVARWARTSVGMIEKHYARQYSFAARAVAIRKVGTKPVARKKLTS